MQSNPHNTQSINSQHSLPDPNPKPMHMKAARRKEQQQVTPIPFLNPDPTAYLIGCSNEASVVIDGQEVTALIDVGTQVSSISAQFCKKLSLHIQPLGWLLELEGMGAAAIPYLRFVEVNPQIPGIRNYNEDVLLWVTLWRCRSSNSMTSKVQFTPHRKSPFPHLAPSMYGQTPVSRTLHASTCPHRASAWSPVASSSGTHSYLWGTTPWFLKGTSLSAQSEHPCHGSTH